MLWHILASRLQLFIWTIKNTASAEPQNQTEAFILGGTLSFLLCLGRAEEWGCVGQGGSQGEGIAALVSTLGRALSFYIRGPKTCGVPGGERETTSEIDCKISNGWTTLPPPEMCLKPPSCLQPRYG